MPDVKGQTVGDDSPLSIDKLTKPNHKKQVNITEKEEMGISCM